MNCEETRELIHGYVDGELDLVNSLAIEPHLSRCRACGETLQENLALRSVIRDSSPYFTAPRSLERRIRQKLHEGQRVEPVPSRGASRLGWLRVGVAFAATMLFAALIWSVVPRNLSPSSDDLLARDIVDDHIRSLMVDHLTDIPSTDQHTVKPWFDGKLDYAPPVKDLSELGFKLIGGRLEYLAGKPVAALVYQHGNHFINLYVWPANRQPETEVAVTKKQGFNLFHWTSGGMTYWAASDLNDTELREFAQLIRT